MLNSSGLHHLQTRQLMMISRGLPLQKAVPVANALQVAGANVLEITWNTPRAANIIDSLRAQFSHNMWIGAGTILDIHQAKQALDCGAQFFVTPHVDEEIITFAAERQIPIFPGAYTPTEIIQAWRAGASAVKIFPTTTRTFEYIKELQGPLAHIPMIALGGINADNVTPLIRLGCYAVGVGASVLNQQAIHDEQYHIITQLATNMLSAIERAKFDEKDLLN